MKGKAAGIVAILVVFCYGFLGIPHGVTPAALKQAVADRINLGLDLKGGIHLVLTGACGGCDQLHHGQRYAAPAGRPGQGGGHGRDGGKLDPVNHPETITISGIALAKSSDARTVLDGTGLQQLQPFHQSRRKLEADDEAERGEGPGVTHDRKYMRDDLRSHRSAWQLSAHGAALRAGRQRDSGGTAWNQRSIAGGGHHPIDRAAGDPCGGKRAV